MKKVLTVVLLLFVVASVVAIVLKEARSDSGAGKRDAKTEETKKSVSASEDEAPVENKEKLIVYYFHGNMRCRTCKTIEALTTQAVEKLFPKGLKDKSVELRAVNVEMTENEHYVEDYKLSIRSVVISRMKADEEVDWERLDRVWELVGDESAFIDYLSEEMKSFTKKGTDV